MDRVFLVYTEWRNGETLLQFFITHEEAQAAFDSAKEDTDVIACQLFDANKLKQWERR